MFIHYFYLGRKWTLYALWISHPFYYHNLVIKHTHLKDELKIWGFWAIDKSVHHCVLTSFNGHLHRQARLRSYPSTKEEMRDSGSNIYHTERQALLVLPSAPTEFKVLNIYQKTALHIYKPQIFHGHWSVPWAIISRSEFLYTYPGLESFD